MAEPHPRRTRLLFVLAAIITCWTAPLGHAAEPAAKHFLWKVTGGKGTAYLFGTIHVGKAELYPLPPVVEDDFTQSDELVEEVDLTSDEQQAGARAAIKTGVYPPGDSIDKHIGETTRTELAAYAKAAGLPPTYTQAKPWLVGVMILQLQVKQLGLDKSEGLDVHFSDEAQKAHKPIAALETADAQLKLLGSLSDELQDKLLLTALLDAKKAEATLNATLAAWQAGDADAMAKVITQDFKDHPSLQPLMQTFFDDRNEAMAQKLDEFLHTPKTYFVAVGAGHLVGPQGIVAKLRERGYAIEQE